MPSVYDAPKLLYAFTLQASRSSLLKGGVFSKDLIETYIDYKMTQEFKQVALRPHPYEFFLYYDI